jgi:hypothetical protein
MFGPSYQAGDPVNSSIAKISRHGERVYLTNSRTPPGTTSSTRTGWARGWPSSTSAGCG